MQECLPYGATVLPIILASDSTQLTGFSGDKAAWPVYITLGNFSASKRQKLNEHTMILLALLPTPPSLPERASAGLQRECRRHNADILQTCFSQLFHSLR